MLYSQTKGVKQKYILCISGLVAYRQYIHNCSNPVDPRLAHGGESTICSSALLGLSLRSQACLCCGSPLLSLVSAMTHRHPSRPLSPQLVDGSPSRSPHGKVTSLRLLSPLSWLCRERLTLSESEYCPTSFPTVHPKVPYK